MNIDIRRYKVSPSRYTDPPFIYSVEQLHKHSRLLSHLRLSGQVLLPAYCLSTVSPLENRLLGQPCWILWHKNKWYAISELSVSKLLGKLNLIQRLRLWLLKSIKMRFTLTIVGLPFISSDDIHIYSSWDSL